MIRCSRERRTRAHAAPPARAAGQALHAAPAGPALARSPATRAFGLDFPALVGLAAGIDRDGHLTRRLARAGLGFTEIGTVNVERVETVAATLAPLLANLARQHAARAQLRVGVSLGTTAPDPGAGAEALARAARLLAPRVDFLVLNLSRPGSAVRAGECATATVQHLLEVLLQALHAGHRRTPLLAKIACPPEHAAAQPLLERVLGAGVAGCICAFEGWSARSAQLEHLRRIVRLAAPVPIVAVGGIEDTADLRRTLAAGARLAQIYGAFVRGGPPRARRLGAVAQPYRRP